MRLPRRSFLTGTAAAALVAAAPLPLLANERLSVVATTGMIADAARQVGGDLIEIKALMGPGVDPHAYRQTRTGLVAATQAHLVLWNGLYLEAQMEEFLLKLGKRRKVVAVAEAVPEELRIAHEDYEGRFDPHVWMVPELWVHVVDAVRAALTDIDPKHAETFSDNAETHLAEINRLGKFARTSLNTVPGPSRVLLSAHDAFGYFGQNYGFEVIGIQGISTESEAGLNRISSLANMLVERDIRAVFVESSVSDRNVRALIEGAAAQGHEVKIGGELFSDAMGEFGTYEGTYVGMIDHNVTTITDALGGDVPPRGMNGKLSVGS